MDRVELTVEQRRLFGLANDESVRLLEARPRTILLERIGGPETPAFPWDRDLVLSADVHSFSLADILNLLHSSHRSGFLYFEEGGHQKSVHLHRGEVVFAASNQAFDRLGNCLLRTGGISAEQLAEATSAYRPPGHFGKVLVERKFLSPRELWNGVKVQVEEIVRSLFSYDAGYVLFWEGEMSPDNVVRLSLPTRRLIAEGLRRRDELIKFLTVLEDPDVRVIAAADLPRGLSGSERAVFELLGSTDCFAELCTGAGVERLAGARTIRHLQLHGAVRVEKLLPSESAAPVPEISSRDRDELRKCIADHLQLIAEIATPIVAFEGPDGIAERLAAVVDEASRRYPELFADLHVGPGGAIDPGEFTARALRFPGEREREVRLALGELVAYLEFEILNHPKISDPDDFLEGVAQLRGRL